ncbi:serine hydrolase [Vallicoccus soli]|uniref:Serine hydrolase n=1 Tax=Vallicoccus soli TaxID=2339232 RepID=A0A3A3ZKK4_9ACTN|nr:serine hydrolase [Vallicoccus soli]RJK96390.1 serine hydrolase [Vallicoccus soli]
MPPPPPPPPPLPPQPAPVPGVAWSVHVLADDGAVLATRGADAVGPVASAAKLLLLVEVARRLDAGDLPPTALLERSAADAVADSGLWQHLRVAALPVEDLAVLVGAVSDNLATNVLLRAVGLPALDALAARLGLRDTRLLDRVRDARGPGDPPVLALGTARELCLLLHGLARGTVVSPAASAAVLRWLGTGSDLSMVASALGLDPLAHAGADRGLLLRHKTGTDEGVRVDAGHLAGPAGGLAYAVAARWSPGVPARDAVLAAMGAYGRALRAAVGG